MNIKLKNIFFSDLIYKLKNIDLKKGNTIQGSAEVKIKDIRFRVDRNDNTQVLFIGLLEILMDSEQFFFNSQIQCALDLSNSELPQNFEENKEIISQCWKQLSIFSNRLITEFLEKTVTSPSSNITIVPEMLEQASVGWVETQ